MDGVLPLALSLTDDGAHRVGAHVRRGLVDVVRPPLDRIEATMRRLERQILTLSIDVIDVFNNVTDRRLKVQVMNEDLRDHIEATRWAVAYFSYNTFLELLDHIAYMRWLDGRSHIHLHDIIGELIHVEWAVYQLDNHVLALGMATIGLLFLILAKLYEGIPVGGTIQIVVTGADPLKDLDLLKLLGLLGLLALGLAIIVAFLFGVGKALATFTLGAIPAAIAVGLLVKALIPLIQELVKLEGWDFAKIAGGFVLIAGFVYALGKAFQQFTTDLEKVVPHLKTFFESIAKLMEVLVKFKGWDFAKIAGGFVLIAGFVYALGKAFQQFTTDLEKVVPHLNTFFESIAKLMGFLAKLKGWDFAKIAGGFVLIAGFVYALGKAFQQFTTDLGKVIPHLNTFFDSIAKLMEVLAKFKPAQMATIVVGFVAIAGFVWLLGKAFKEVTSDLDKIVPQLDRFFTSIGNLMTALAKFKPGEMATIAVGFLLIAGFVWLLGKALATLTESAISAIDPLGRFFTAITGLIAVLKQLTPGDLAIVALSFVAIAGFVWGLSMALGTLTQRAVDALPGMASLMTAFATLASTLGKLTGGEFAMMVASLAVITGFVWAMAAALNFAAGPLASLAKLAGALSSALSLVGDVAGKVWGVLSDVGGFIGDIGSGIGDFFGTIGGGISDLFSGDLFGSIDVNALMNQSGLPSAAPPPPPMVASAAPGLGALSPGGALAVAPAGGPAAVDQTVNAGGISISITADRLEANSAQLLTDDIVAQLQARLGALRSTQDFQAGARPAVA